MARAKKLVDGSVYTVKFPSLKELLSHKDLTHFSKEEGEISLKHQSIYFDQLGKTVVLEYNDGTFYLGDRDLHSNGLLKYVEVVDVEIPFVLKANK